MRERPQAASAACFILLAVFLSYSYGIAGDFPCFAQSSIRSETWSAKVDFDNWLLGTGSGSRCLLPRGYQ